MTQMDSDGTVHGSVSVQGLAPWVVVTPAGR